MSVKHRYRTRQLAAERRSCSGAKYSDITALSFSCLCGGSVLAEQGEEADSEAGKQKKIVGG